MYSKKDVSDSFSKHSSSYDKYADAQAKAAGFLVSFIRENSADLPCGPVLEIGCGTGFVTREIVPSMPDRKFLITDISGKMADLCRNNLSMSGIDISSSIFAAFDGESSWPDKRFAMIYSGFTFQWFQDLEKAIQNLFCSLLPGGILAFSFQADGSFAEWESVCRLLDIPFTANPLPSMETCESILKDQGGTLFKKVEIPVIYPSSAHFFKSLKNIGAGTMSKNEHLSPSEMKKLIKCWDEISNNMITVTYVAGFVIVRKR